MSVAFARFDLRSWALTRTAMLPLVMVALVGVVLPVPGMAVVAAALVVSVTLSTPFLGDEKGQLDTLYGILPVPRGAVVAGRALAVVVYYLAAAALATLVPLVVAAVRGDVVPTSVLLLAHGAAAALLGLSAMVQLPVLFRVGFARGRLIAYAPPLGIAGAAWVAQALDVLGPVQDLASGVPGGALLAVGVAVGAVGLAVGTALATREYRRREL